MQKFYKNLDRTAKPVHKWGTMLAIGLGVLMATLDMSIINLALPTLVRELETTFPTVQWVILSYVLVITSMMLSVGRLGDIVGKKKLYMVGVVVFTVGSLFCGFSPTIGLLIGFRGLQGSGAVMMQALGTAIIVEVFPSTERGRAMGVIGGIVSVGLALGPAIGGVLIGLFGWQSVFLINVPIGIVSGFMVMRLVPSSVRNPQGDRFDIFGAVIVLVLLISYASGMTLCQKLGIRDPRVIGLLLCCGFSLAAFILVEKRVVLPMIDLNLFKNFLFSLNLLMGFVVFIALAATFLLPFFLEFVKGYPTAKVGLMMMIVPVSMGLIAPGAGMLSDRFGSRGISVLGLSIAAGGCLAISTLHAEVDTVGYVLRLVPMGVGLGLFLSPNNSAIMGAAPGKHLGIVSGLLSLSRTLGHTTGVPLMGVIYTTMVISAEGISKLSHITSANAESLVFGLSKTFYAAAFMFGGAAVLATIAWKKDRST